MSGQNNTEEVNLENINILDLSSNQLIDYMSCINPYLAGAIVASIIHFAYDREVVIQPIDDIPNTVIDTIYGIFSFYFYTGNDVDKENFYYKCDEDNFRSSIHYII